MERIDDLMERLKGQMPEVPDADALTDSIMAAIEEKEDRKPVVIPMWISVLRSVTSVAAAVLLVLFIHLKNDAQPVAGNPDNVYLEVVSDECRECSPAENYNLRREKLRLMNRRRILKDKYYASYGF